ncbi:MAG: N-acetylneuraminate synthase family protein [Ignavibacteriae bacterium]|nr:N-acetylneuraminate synthase family protein [Ignavibacteriota bacterium]
MTRTLQIGSRPVGDGHPVYIIAEIGINHNGSLDNAKRLIDAASDAGCDAVKFQKRTPELCVPEAQKSKMRETPWGYITYLEYRHKVEFWKEEYEDIAEHCRARGIDWFASCWDEEAVDFMESFDPPCYKVQSAAVTDTALLEKLRGTGKPLLLSTGMSTMDEIRSAVSLLDVERLLIMHATSTYPCPNTQLNLNMIRTLRDVFPCPVGYSGHEVGLPTTAAAVALGACAVERHITLDRSMWGSDQAASIEPGGFKRLVTYIRAVEDALGDGIKQVYPEESIARERLRRV